MSNIPVLLLIYNRPKYTKKNIDNLRKIKPKRIFIFCDGPKNIKDKNLSIQAIKETKKIDWNNLEIAVPAFLTMVLMPFTFSIADGIAWGVISYVAIQMIVGKAKDVNMVMWAIFALMSMFYLGPGNETTFEWILGNLN